MKSTLFLAKVRSLEIESGLASVQVMSDRGGWRMYCSNCGAELAAVVDERMHYYNTEGRHSAIGYLLPLT